MPQKNVKSLQPHQSLEPFVLRKTSELIGRVVTEWARLEATHEKLIWYFLKLDREDGKTITATLDARTKTRILRRLISRYAKPKATKEKALELIGMAEELQEKRNEVVHGIWMILRPDGIPVSTLLRAPSDPFRVVSMVYPHERLKEIASLITDLAVNFDRLPSALIASRNKHEQRIRESKKNRRRSQPGHNREAH